ncbi:hypothetical protein LCGC14_1683030 [marine sediment metagenome]|uniref:TtsA-like Glycoside hydrolase family 108 domain-containing protein n=1 Tax=marine sediment metagenome TaxID=412755 RepID=A0A0F9HNI8_9ZZZZ
MTTTELVEGILKREGSTYTHDSAAGDPPTRFGVTPTALKAYRRKVLGWTVARSRVTADDIRALTRDEAILVYRHLYIEGPQFDKIPDRLVRLLVVDWGVHSGPPLAARKLQKAVGQVLKIALVVDGVVGRKTLAAVNRANGWAIAHRLILLRAEHQAVIIRRSVLAACPSALKRTKLRYDWGWRRRHLGLLA